MSQKRKKYHVFLSHNSVDKPWVNRLKDALEGRGLKVWLDQYEIRPGDLFVDALEKGLESSRTVALIISPEGMQSGWVDEEYNRAIGLAQDKNEKIRLIPVILRTTKLPGFLSGRNWVDFTDESSFDGSLEKLIWGITGKKPGSKLSLSLTPQKTHESTRISEASTETTSTRPDELISRLPIQCEMQAPVNVPSPYQGHSEHTSFNDILILAFTYHEEIQAEQSRLMDVTGLFSNVNIWRDECEGAADSLREISKPVKRFCKLLDELDPSQLTETVVELSYALMTPLHDSDDLLNELVSDITVFSRVCHEATRETMLRKEQIQEKLTALQKHIDEVDIYVSSFKKTL
jgi:TIR domain